MPERYRVTFTVQCPVSESDYEYIVRFGSGNYRNTDGFEAFAKHTAAYKSLEFVTTPVDLETATLVKMRFSGRIEKID